MGQRVEVPAGPAKESIEGGNDSGSLVRRPPEREERKADHVVEVRHLGIVECHELVNLVHGGVPLVPRERPVERAGLLGATEERPK